MSRNLKLLAGPKAALRAYVRLVPAARAFALTPGASLFVMPLTAEVHEALHAAYGTGEWITTADEDRVPLLTSTDAAFAAGASRGCALAFVETDYFGGTGSQTAAAWIDGGIAQRLATLEEGSARPRSLWPINAALRVLGVSAVAGRDEFEALGLGAYRTNEEVAARALPIIV